MKATISFKVAGVVLFCLFTVARSGGADEPENKATSSPFAGKMVMISVKDPSAGGCLEKVEVRKLGGREFLVGNAVPVDASYSAISGRKQWIALDAVLTIYEFKDLAEMKSVYYPEKTQRPAK
jgi:hypothetical protein